MPIEPSFFGSGQGYPICRSGETGRVHFDRFLALHATVTTPKCVVTGRVVGLEGGVLVADDPERLGHSRRAAPVTLALPAGEPRETHDLGTIVLPGLPEACSRAPTAPAASRRLREGFEESGLEYLLPPELRSNTITPLRLPPGVRYDPLHDRLKERGYVIYAGQGRLGEVAFRVANMGRISEADLAAFGGHLRAGIAQVRGCC
jgi:hypothetical protein